MIDIMAIKSLEHKTLLKLLITCIINYGLCLTAGAGSSISGSSFLRPEAAETKPSLKSRSGIIFTQWLYSCVINWLCTNFVCK